MGTSMLVLTGARLVGNLCSWQCANIPCFKPPPSWQTRVVSSIVSLPLSIVLHILTRFERRRTCLCCYMCAPFLPFSSHKFLHLFTFAHPFFPASFYSFFPFFIVLFLYPIFTRTFVIAQHFFSARFNRCDYPPVSFSFHSSQSSRNLRLLTTHIPPYSPRVVVIVLILSTLGWCLLNVIIGKISVFLSTDSQSTGSLTLKSHVPVFALLSPLIIVASGTAPSKSRRHNQCILSETSTSMSKLRPLLSSDWEWVKLSPRVHRIQNGGRPIHKLHRVGSRHL